MTNTQAAFLAIPAVIIACSIWFVAGLKYQKRHTKPVVIKFFDYNGIPTGYDYIPPGDTISFYRCPLNKQ